MKFWQGFFLIAVCAGCAVAAEQATLTSDELELEKNGEVTVFRGNVILKQAPYEIRSAKMTRLKSTGNVTATGKVIGTWISPKLDRVRVESDEALYKANEETVELWGKGPVQVHLFGQKDEAHFRGDRGWIFTRTPGKARLVGRVTGHVIPG